MKSVINYIIIAAFILIFQPVFVCATNDDGRWWDDDFDAIVLEPIASQSQTQQGFKAVILYVSGDSVISADNSIAAQLRNATDSLVTEYKLAFDKDGTNGTGAANTNYVEYNSFTPVAITHYPADDDVEVTLWVRASNRPDNVADSGLYNATQTLTVSW